MRIHGDLGGARRADFAMPREPRALCDTKCRQGVTGERQGIAANLAIGVRCSIVIRCSRLRMRCAGRRCPQSPAVTCLCQYATFEKGKQRDSRQKGFGGCLQPKGDCSWHAEQALLSCTGGLFGRLLLHEMGAQDAIWKGGVVTHGHDHLHSWLPRLRWPKKNNPVSQSRFTMHGAHVMMVFWVGEGSNCRPAQEQQSTHHGIVGRAGISCCLSLVSPGRV